MRVRSPSSEESAATAWAHPEGFHARFVFTLTKTVVTGVLVLDIDSGERCELLRAGADVNHDGVLSKAERATLLASSAMSRRSPSLAASILVPLSTATPHFPVFFLIKEQKLVV